MTQTHYDNWVQHEYPPIPDFDGKPVAGTTLKVSTGTQGLDVDGAVVRMDDIVRLVVEVRVTQVDHRVNERTGALIRHQTAKVITAAIAPWNPDDPEDTGIIHD